MTDAKGLCFLSYRRVRSSEAELLVGALRDRGIPTWQDISDLATTPTEDELRRVLSDPTTASAILFVTPEVEHSAIIRDVEAPNIVRRHLTNDGFFAVPVAAGGLGYSDLGRVLGPNVGPTHLPSWNVHRTKANPIDYAAASEVADLVLKQRIAALNHQLPLGEALGIAVATRAPLPKLSSAALSVDLTHRFTGRTASASTWNTNILPGIRAIVHALQSQAHGRDVELSGLVALPAAVALGATFLSVGGTRTRWIQDQQTFGKAPESWSLDAARHPSGYKVQTHSRIPGATDLAILVSVAADVTADFNITSSSLPELRAVVSVSPPTAGTRTPLTAGEAIDVAHLAIDAIRSARATYHTLGTIHLFLAVPAGLAMMIGQLLNTLGRVQTYEHIPSTAVPYQPAALLTPSV